MDWHELEKKKVTELREMAKEKLGIEGVTGLHKEELVEKLAEAMDIPKPHKVVEGGAKKRIKARIRELKQERDKALEAKDPAELKRVRREMHRMRRKLRRQAHLVH